MNTPRFHDGMRLVSTRTAINCAENHKEVREHAPKPLGDNVKKILTEQPKTRLAKLFDEWTTGGGNSSSADLALATP